MRLISRLTIKFVLTAIIVTGCSLPREARFTDIATRAGFESGTVTSGEYELRFYKRQTAADPNKLTIYLEGDGSPWATPSIVARDPTARRPTALELMSHDPGNTLYLARPCYHQPEAPGCPPRMWTDGRYSELVVDTMADAIRSLTDSSGSSPDIRLVGFSGGGVLAVLLAERVPRVTEVVTLAANLDTEGWTRFHRYSKLGSSLNPAARAPLPEHIHQLHLFGGEDANVPPHLARPFAEKQQNAVVAVVPDFDHQCCWEAAWSKVLASLSRWTDICSDLRAHHRDIDCRRTTD